MNSDLHLDKFELHYRQQLSALMDSDLAPDQARFLLRRLRHDEELNAQWERWQLLADVLRGQAVAPAPAGFADRVGAAIAAGAGAADASHGAPTQARSRGGLLRWGGALAASVAAVALFVGRQQSPEVEEAIPLAAAPVASPSPAAAPSISLADASPAARETVAAPVVATPPPIAATRRSATRTQQAARVAAASRKPQPQRAAAGIEAAPTVAPVLVADAASATAAPSDPFASAVRDVHVPSARPWPRSVLQGLPSGNAFSASYGGNDAVRAFHPFEPRALPDSPPIALPADAEPQD
ncbi:MAG: RseA family anti-sigma factor [Pseudoxanthomonas sp.]